MRGRWVALVVVFWVPSVWADTIALRGHVEPIQGQVVEETADTFVIAVPKVQVQRIERDQTMPPRQAPAAPKILWEERDGYVILQIPQAQVERKDGLATAALPLGRPGGTGAGLPVGSGALPPDPRLGTIAGQVTWDSQPLAACRIKAVMISSTQPLAAVAKLLGRTADASAEEGFVAEAVTDQAGRYTFPQVPPGEYDVYWQPAGAPSAQWIRRLRDKPDLVVLAGEVTTHPNIEAHVQVMN